MKVWLTLMTGPKSLSDLRELWEPIKGFFAGICAVYFGERNDDEAVYLEANKGEGRIIYLPYTGRHDLARNVCIHNGIIENGDWIIHTDTLEHPQVGFLSEIMPSLIRNGNIDCYMYYGKPFLYRYHETLFFKGSPHEGLQRFGIGLAVAELASVFPDDSKIRLNTRPRKRDKWHFVKHYGRYALLPYGSNHYLLALSGKPDAERIFVERETARIQFIELLRELGIKRNVDAVIEYMKGPMDPRFVAHVEKDKIWNDVYRYYILGREDFVDNHDWNDVVKVLDSKVQPS